MFWACVPTHFVVGTDLAHMTGKSIVSARIHRALGHVDLRLVLLMVVGTVPGVELGAPLPHAFLEQIMLGRVAPKILASNYRSTLIVRCPLK